MSAGARFIVIFLFSQFWRLDAGIFKRGIHPLLRFVERLIGEADDIYCMDTGTTMGIHSNFTLSIPRRKVPKG